MPKIKVHIWEDESYDYCLRVGGEALGDKSIEIDEELYQRYENSCKESCAVQRILLELDEGLKNA